MNRIKILREEYGYTQQELAEKLDGAKSTIAMYENETRRPSLEVLINLSKIFNCSIDYLMGLTSNTETIEISINKKQSKIEQILDLANGLSIPEVNYLIKQLNKAKIKIDEEIINGTRMD